MFGLTHIMPIYYYKNVTTGEEFEHTWLSIPKNPAKDLILSDGTICERIYHTPMNLKRSFKRRRLISRMQEIFESDPEYVSKVATPGYTRIRFQDGHKEIYDPNKHN